MVTDKSFIATGTQRIFSSDFAIISDEHLRVYLDNTVVAPTKYDLINNAAVFHTAPAVGIEVTVQVGTTPDDLLTHSPYGWLDENNLKVCADNIVAINAAEGNATTATTQAGIATTQEGIAATKAGESLASADASSSSAFTAGSWASNANDSATDAAGSASDAAVVAAEAAEAAVVAAAAGVVAGVVAVAAEAAGSASDAAGSAGDASGSASDAAGSAGDASGSAGDASGSASDAAGSATASDISAGACAAFTVSSSGFASSTAADLVLTTAAKEAAVVAQAAAEAAVGSAAATLVNDVAANTLKVGITSQQASDISTNNNKVSNVSHPVVLTAVPAQAVFTDSVLANITDFTTGTGVAVNTALTISGTNVPKVFTQNSAPTSGHTAGDLWVDSDGYSSYIAIAIGSGFVWFGT